MILKRSYRRFIRVIGLSHDKTSRNLFRLFQSAVYLILSVFIIGIVSIPYSDNIGVFGDFFGGLLNPLLTFLTFMGLLITIILQQKELRLTRKELAITSTALKEQSTTLEKQRFEDTFFSLFNQHNEILKELNNSSVILKAHKYCFGNANNLSELKTSFNDENYLLGHYFRLLYQLLKLIAVNNPESKLGGEFNCKQLIANQVGANEKTYSNMVRAVLSNEVTQLLVANCYSENKEDQYERYRILISRYQFFEHMSFKVNGLNTDILQSAIKYYGKSSFGENEEMEKLNLK